MSADAIDSFIGHFEGQIAKIESVAHRPYRKLLYSAALDPLARAAFGNIGHRERITRLIDQFSNWSAKDKISLPQLNLALKETRRARYRLYRLVHKRLREWPPGEILRLTLSPSLAELQQVADPTEEKTLQRCRYAALFYTYRNNLVHEFREPGYGIEMSSDRDQAYYHSEIGGPWQLVFPVGFFATTYANVLRNLEQFLRAQGIDPYSQFEFGSLWRS